MAGEIQAPPKYKSTDGRLRKAHGIHNLLLAACLGVESRFDFLDFNTWHGYGDWGVLS